MTTLEATKSKTSSGTTRSGRLFVLELSGDRIHSMNPDGSDRKTIVTDCRRRTASSWMRKPVISVGPTSCPGGTLASIDFLALWLNAQP